MGDKRDAAAIVAGDHDLCYRMSTVPVKEKFGA